MMKRSGNKCVLSIVKSCGYSNSEEKSKERKIDEKENNLLFLKNDNLAKRKLLFIDAFLFQTLYYPTNNSALDIFFAAFFIIIFAILANLLVCFEAYIFFFIPVKKKLFFQIKKLNQNYLKMKLY